MTSKNLNLRHRPFLLKPAAKDYLWGGSRLNDDFSKGISMNPLAETWECSTHPDGQSTVAGGEHRGRTLGEVLSMHPEYLGSHPSELMKRGAAGQESCGGYGALPILIKLIDAKRNLSVQVHPDDIYAREHENGSMGKTEMWYVLEAARDTELIYGFYSDMEQEKLRESIEQGTVEKYLRKVPIKKDDVFLIEAGTVHAIGAGALIVEIQENSNLTYRLYDYNRRDKNGNVRELHVDKALAVADLKGGAAPRQSMRVIKYRRGYALELLCRCKYFQVERMHLNTERTRDMADFQTGSNSFQVLLCTSGCGVLMESKALGKNAAVPEEEVSAEKGQIEKPVVLLGDGECSGENDMGKEDIVINFFKGDCIFIPANSVSLKIHGKAQMLNVTC